MNINSKISHLSGEKKLFQEFSAGKSLKHSQKRDWILETFLAIEKHLTVYELWAAVKKKHPSVGFATVYRTLRLLCESGLCRELLFDDGTTRYEHLFEHEHHDHLICTKCGTFVEVVEPEIERLQEELMKRHGFSPLRHRMDLYGICRKCKK
jgi:Fur family ferric uptake transcriptional regulator